MLCMFAPAMVALSSSEVFGSRFEGEDTLRNYTLASVHAGWCGQLRCNNRFLCRYLQEYVDVDFCKLCVDRHF